MRHIAAAVIRDALPNIVLCPGINCPSRGGDGPCEVDTAAAHELLDALAEAGIVPAVITDRPSHTIGDSE